MDLAFAAVGFGNRGVDHFDHDGRDVDARAVAFDERNDRIVGNGETKVLVDRDFPAAGRDLHVLIRGHERSCWTRSPDGLATKHSIIAARASVLSSAAVCQSAPRGNSNRSLMIRRLLARLIPGRAARKPRVYGPDQHSVRRERLSHAARTVIRRMFESTS